MSWCVIKHKWVYKNEDINLSYNLPNHGLRRFELLTTKVRLCSRCHKKQRQIILRTSMSSEVIDWVDYELSLEEQREIKLKELGI